MRGARLAQWLWCAVGIALAAGLAIELAAGRLLVLVQGRAAADHYRVGFPEMSQEWLLDFNRQMADTVHPFDLDGTSTEWWPYVHWRNRPYQGRDIQVDARGLRRTVEPAASSGAGSKVRIFMFGGSAMWGYGNRDEATIPSCLARELAAAGLACEVTNFGQIGYVNSQSLYTLVDRLREGDVPHLAIFFDGYNDISGTYWNLAPGLPLKEDVRRAEFNLLNGSPLELAALAVDNSATARLMRLLRGGARRQLVHPVDDGTWTYRRLADETTRAYLANVRAAAALGREFGFEGLYFIQPVLYAKRPLSPGEQAQFEGRQEQEEMVLTVYAAYRQAVLAGRLEAGWSQGLRYLGEAFNAPEWGAQTAFFDRAHLIEAANQYLARLMAREVQELLDQRPPAPLAH